jgi:hypothetical protein
VDQGWGKEQEKMRGEKKEREERGGMLRGKRENRSWVW